MIAQNHCPSLGAMSARQVNAATEPHSPPPGVQYLPTPLLFPVSPGLTQEPGGVASPPLPPVPLDVDVDVDAVPPLPLDEVSVLEQAAATAMPARKVQRRRVEVTIASALFAHFERGSERNRSSRRCARARIAPPSRPGAGKLGGCRGGSE
jgi:hypothetical protein